MKDHYKNKSQLIAELQQLRQQLKERDGAPPGEDALVRRNAELENDACVIVRRTQRMEALTREIRRSNQRLRESNEALAYEGAIHHTLADLAGALISSATVSEISRLVLSRARRLTRSAAGFVGHIDPKSGYFVCPALEVETDQGVSSTRREVVFRRTHGLWGQAIEGRGVLRLNPPIAPLAADGLPDGLPHPESLLAVPARIADEVLGLIVVQDAPEGYGEADESLLLQLASLYAVALERSRTEVRTRDAVIMEMATNLAAGVAHDFNNLMVGVMGYGELLRSDLAGDADKLRMLDVIITSARRAGNLAHQMLAFSGGNSYSPRLLCLNSVVADALRHSSAVPESVGLQLDLCSELWDTEADPAQIAQVLEHLCVNAVEAMDGCGSLLVSTSNVSLGGRDADSRPALPPGDYVCLTVEDTGCGMDADTRAKLFEPFYTTKFQGRGLGLSAVYGIVKNHRGGIAYFSEPGEGSVFRVYLPARGVVDPVDITDLPGGSETVLIVDDEELVLSLTRRELEQWGYRVLEARDGREALRMAESDEGEIALVLLDLGMPVMGGREALPLLRERLPGARIVVCSGYGQQSTIEEMLAAGADDFIVKPFRLESLATTVRRQLDRV